MYVTPAPWNPKLLQHEQYGTDETYRRAAGWVADCATVADWGGASGALLRFLPSAVRYHVVDGTAQGPGQRLADLRYYHEASDGIVLRHVLDMTHGWAQILENAMLACRRRLVVVTFTPDADETHVAQIKSGWPVRHFDPEDIRRALGPWLVSDERVETTHPERIYYAARR